MLLSCRARSVTPLWGGDKDATHVHAMSKRSTSERLTEWQDSKANYVPILSSSDWLDVKEVNTKSRLSIRPARAHFIIV
jgi:hypothetical protein